MLKYILRAFSQTLPDSAVYCDVQCVSDSPAFAVSIACPPIEMTKPDWTNEDLLAEVSKATGQKVELPTTE